MIQIVLKRNENFLIFLLIAVITSLLLLQDIISILVSIGEAIDTQAKSFLVAYLLLVLVLLYWYLPKIFRGFLFNKKVSFVVAYTSSVYLILRLGVSEIAFAPFFVVWKYTDLLLLLLILHLVVVGKSLYKEYSLTIRNENREYKDSLPFFLQDALFTEKEIDNEKILKKLIKSIGGFKPDNSFSIGLNAIWGYGKSSFLKKFEIDYRSQNPRSIIFWNHIWKNKGSQAIIENFFEELKENLRPFSSAISKDIDKYVEAILSLGPKNLSDFLTSGMDGVFNDETLESHYEDINRNIRLIDRQIIILLDDLDRLEKEEILSALKLIRTISDFNNIIFIAGYDRNYITDTIESSKNNYLDKIFNVELNLLPFEEKRISEELLKYIQEIFPSIKPFENILLDSFRTLFDIVEELEPDLGKGLKYKHFLSTHRDIKRFLNEFKFFISFLESHQIVVLYEYILLRLLTYKNRRLHDALVIKLEDFLSLGKLDDINQKIQKDLNGVNPDILIYDQLAKERIENSLKFLTEEDKNLINIVLSVLFGERDFSFYQENQNCISKIYYTNVYIRNNIASGNVTIYQMQNSFEQAELKKLYIRSSSSQKVPGSNFRYELKTFILKLTIETKEQLFDILESLNLIIDFNSTEDDKKFTEILNHGIFKFFGSNTRDFLEEFKIIYFSEPNGYLDRFLDDHNRKLKESEEEFAPFNAVETKELLLGKLKSLVDEEKSTTLLFPIYYINIEAIIPEHITLRSIEANNLIRSDIEERFHLYFQEDFFRIYEEEDLWSGKVYHPNHLIAEIFSDKDKLSDLMVSRDKSTYLEMRNSGWKNFLMFLQDLLNNRNDIEKEFAHYIIQFTDFIELFINNNYESLKKEQYDQLIRNE